MRPAPLADDAPPAGDLPPVDVSEDVVIITDVSESDVEDTSEEVYDGAVILAEVAPPASCCCEPISCCGCPAFNWTVAVELGAGFAPSPDGILGEPLPPAIAPLRWDENDFGAGFAGRLGVTRNLADCARIEVRAGYASWSDDSRQTGQFGFRGVPGAGVIASPVVSGPTLIDNVSIQGCNGDGIQIDGADGSFQVGDPLNMVAPTFTIAGCGGNGIGFAGLGQTPVLQGAQALQGGPTLSVYGGQILQCGQNGIVCDDANLDVSTVSIDDCYNAILNRVAGSDCTTTIADTDIGVSDPMRAEGIIFEPFFGGILADVTNTIARAQDSALRGGDSFGSGVLILSVDGCTFESGLSAFINAVNVFGAFGNTVVTEFNDVTVVGNGNGAGVFFSAVTFDADPFMDPGAQTVSGGVCQVGSSVANRIQGTALTFSSCDGELTFTSTTIFQQGGDPTGISNMGGSLVLVTGTTSVNHIP